MRHRPVDQRESGCEGKTRFNQRRVAERVRQRQNAALHVYRCTFCGGWHLGTSMGRKSR